MTGPSLWHFENDLEARSIELPLHDVKKLAKRIGFEILVRSLSDFPCRLTLILLDHPGGERD